MRVTAIITIVFIFFTMISSMNCMSSSYYERREARHLRRMERDRYNYERMAVRYLRRMEMNRYYYDECHDDYSNNSILTKTYCTIYGIYNILLGICMIIAMIIIIPFVIYSLSRH